MDSLYFDLIGRYAGYPLGSFKPEAYLWRLILKEIDVHSQSLSHRFEAGFEITDVDFKPGAVRILEIVGVAFRFVG